MIYQAVDEGFGFRVFKRPGSKEESHKIHPVPDSIQVQVIDQVSRMFCLGLRIRSEEKEDYSHCRESMYRRGKGLMDYDESSRLRCAMATFLRKPRCFARRIGLR